MNRLTAKCGTRRQVVEHACSPHLASANAPTFPQTQPARSRVRELSSHVTQLCARKAAMIHRGPRWALKVPEPARPCLLAVKSLEASLLALANAPPWRGNSSQQASPQCRLEGQSRGFGMKNPLLGKKRIEVGPGAASSPGPRYQEHRVLNGA